jgi:hypothetical protein
MFALNRMSIARDDMHYNDWAVQLANAIHGAFVYARDTPRPHMYWKMSIDLRRSTFFFFSFFNYTTFSININMITYQFYRPAVHSEGNLDPFDGYVTYRILAERCPDKEGTII